MAGQVGSDRRQSGSIETAAEQPVRPEEIKPETRMEMIARGMMTRRWFPTTEVLAREIVS